MKRNISLEEVSDGRLYDRNDMVKAGCDDCRGCSACCHGMGNSIVLDPYDIYRLTACRGVSFESLLEGKAELHVVDGIILPSLSMSGPDEACGFLNEEGRCSIHPYRPGICRLFPLGRIYEEDGFHYFLQIHECARENRTKVKVKKWIDTPDLPRYEEFINRWHIFLTGMQEEAARLQDPEKEKELSLFVLKLFYLLPYHADRDFYSQFEERMRAAQGV